MTESSISFSEYAFRKLTLRLNFQVTGIKDSFVINTELINKLVNSLDGFGSYEVIMKYSFPIKLNKLNDTFISSDYVNPGVHSRHIEFNEQEFRDYRIRKILA